VEPVKAKKSGKCWNCAVDTHAAKDCMAQHYYLVCNNADHPTVRYPTLKLPRPSTFVTGNGTEETIFLQLPNSVFKGHLKPKNAPVAKVTITGVVVPSTAIEAVMARICPLNLQWKWEALSHDAASFLVNFPSIQDLDRVNGIQMGVPDYDAQFKLASGKSRIFNPSLIFLSCGSMWRVCLILFGIFTVFGRLVLCLALLLMLIFPRCIVRMWFEFLWQ
jgi:hypothetical protein